MDKLTGSWYDVYHFMSGPDMKVALRNMNQTIPTIPDQGLALCLDVMQDMADPNGFLPIGLSSAYVDRVRIELAARMVADCASVEGYCYGCENATDPGICHCGSDIDHSYASGHSPVPMGCTCFRDDHYVDPASYCVVCHSFHSSTEHRKW